MATYKLIYYPIRGRAESIRLLFAHAGVEYTDERIPPSDWPALKEQMPLKQMPVLVVDEKTKIGETTVILRYLARQFGLEGTTPLEIALADMLGEAIQDVFAQIFEWVLMVVGLKQGDKEAEYVKTVVPAINNIGAIFEQFLKENGSGWLVGNSVTWADFHAAAFFDRLVTYGNANALDAFPLIKKHIRRVYELPNIKKYVAKRPETPF